MSNRQALIVDDSRSARHILGRMLESAGLQVNAVESAEQALTYLQGARPDVIFMDHLMPGMDGFAAVRLIKANPKTAAIPVLMYTSQEGEMYLSQARALGVVGVVPKTLKQADVATVLQQLNLLEGTPPARPAEAPAPARTIAPAVEVLHVGTQEVLDVPSNPSTSAAHDRLAYRLAAEVRAELAANVTPPAQLLRTLRWLIALLLVVLAVAALCLYQVMELREQLVQLSAPALPAAASLPVSHASGTSLPLNMESSIESSVSASEPETAAALATRPLRVETEPYLYGEVPLSGPRVDHLRRLLDNLRADHFRGLIRVSAYTADFCLSGSTTEGYQLAMDELPAKQCDHIGNPFADSLAVTQRQSVAFANLLASALNSPIQIDVIDAGRMPATPYPLSSATLTAADWNRVAERNQRVEFAVLPAP